VDVPAGLVWLADGEPGGDAWLRSLPRLVAECAARWDLSLGGAFDGHVSFVAPATLRNGRRAVLKVNFPSEESDHEADALAHWCGRGAVRLLAEDPSRRALLLERCDPGTTLWELSDEDEANAVAADVLRRLWREPPPRHPFRLLSVEARRWAAALPVRWERLGRPFERELLDAAVFFLGTAGEAERDASVVLHQDLHGGNILRAQREPWLAIDPKPLVGEREFDVASLLRDRRPALLRDGDPTARVRRRLDRLSVELGLDRERARGWGIAHALAWGLYDDRLFPDHVACARWLAAA
jgi:streptomycin 6-kinase